MKDLWDRAVLGEYDNTGLCEYMVPPLRVSSSGPRVLRVPVSVSRALQWKRTIAKESQGRALNEDSRGLKSWQPNYSSSVSYRIWWFLWETKCLMNQYKSISSLWKVAALPCLTLKFVPGTGDLCVRSGLGLTAEAGEWDKQAQKGSEFLAYITQLPVTPVFWVQIWPQLGSFHTQGGSFALSRLLHTSHYRQGVCVCSNVFHG